MVGNNRRYTRAVVRRVSVLKLEYMPCGYSALKIAPHLLTNGPFTAYEVNL